MKLTLNRVIRYLKMQKRVNDLLMKMKAPNRNYQTEIIKIAAASLGVEQGLRKLQQKMVKDQEGK